MAYARMRTRMIVLTEKASERQARAVALAEHVTLSDMPQSVIMLSYRRRSLSLAGTPDPRLTTAGLRTDCAPIRKAKLRGRETPHFFAVPPIVPVS